MSIIGGNSLFLILGSFLTLSVILSCSTTSAQSDKVVFCYWGTWSFYKEGIGNFKVEDIDVHLCTHVIYAFLGLAKNSENGYYEPECLDPWLDLPPQPPHWCNHKIKDDPNQIGNHDNIRHSINDMKLRNPEIKILLGIGGWSVESEKFSELSENYFDCMNFGEKALQMVQEFGFDGVDIDWEYPTLRGGRPQDKENFIQLLEIMRIFFPQDVGILSIAIGLGADTVEQAYILNRISPTVDYILLMAYDYKMYLPDTGEYIGHHSPLYPKESESEGDKQLSVEWSVNNVILKGADPAKLVLGVGAYGKTWEIDGKENGNFYDHALGPGQAFPYSQEAGTIAYYEICSETLNSGYDLHFDYDYFIPYMLNDTTWIGYDDEYSAMEKVDFAMSRGMAGMMVWSIEMDDARNFCGGWYKFPITSALKNRLEQHKSKEIENAKNENILPTS